ncbi:MAG: hypothetical protein LBG20_03550 [Holosporaceae bacterium]|jgi:hypothetical protein|nr:hypothetical protein [Holosporaceae bacterium]
MKKIAMRMLAVSLSVSLYADGWAAETEETTQQEGTDEPSCCSHDFTGVYLGIGAGCQFSKNELKDTTDNTKATFDNNAVGGSAVLGARKVFGNFCIGAEVGGTVGPTKTSDVKDGNVKVRTIRNRGSLVNLGLTVGGVHAEKGWHGFGIIGFYFPHTTLKDANNNGIGSDEKPVVLVGVGAEKKFTQKWGARVDLGYGFDNKKRFEYAGSKGEWKGNGGLVLKLLATYHVPTTAR